ncbi:MAG TPA: hypothetical protein PKN75_03670 [Bacteroidia bacterium]|nr:hypothetical protein [Bacteroidia bacterium]HNU32668.1 hypothetical protein [Bacteroidia bacterium]
MEDYKNINDELKEFGSSLHKMEKQNPFAVPENYFENLNSIVQDKIAAQKKISRSEQFSGFMAAHKLSLATCAIVLALGSVYYFKSAQQSISNDTSTEFALSDEELNTLAGELDEHTLAEIYINESTESSQNDSLQLDDYLIENNIDVNTLINEL